MWPDATSPLPTLQREHTSFLDLFLSLSLSLFETINVANNHSSNLKLIALQTKHQTRDILDATQCTKNKTPTREEKKETHPHPTKTDNHIHTHKEPHKTCTPRVKGHVQPAVHGTLLCTSAITTMEGHTTHRNPHNHTDTTETKRTNKNEITPSTQNNTLQRG